MPYTYDQCYNAYMTIAPTTSAQQSPPFILREYQRTAINKIVRGFRSCERGQLIMASGTGKTAVSYLAFKRMRVNAALVLVPSLALISQTIQEWRKLGFKETALIVASDVTTGQVPNLGGTVTVTTDVDTVAAWRRRNPKGSVFCTYQSSEVLLAAGRVGMPPFDLLIADEAHRATGDPTSQFSACVLPEYPAVRRLFCTATPKFFSNQNTQPYVHSMDNERYYGRPFFKYTFRQAINDGYLTDYLIYCVQVTKKQLQHEINQRITEDVGNVTVLKEDLAGIIAMAKAISEHKLQSIISYHSMINRAKRFSDLLSDVAMHSGVLPEGYTIKAQHMSGMTPVKQRMKHLELLHNRQDTQSCIISNAQVLVAGQDIPALDGIFYADAKNSVIDTIQSAGRVLRPYPGKELGVILVACIVDEKASSVADLPHTEWRKVVTVINSLRSMDEQLGIAVDTARYWYARKRSRDILSNELIAWDADGEQPQFSADDAMIGEQEAQDYLDAHVRIVPSSEDSQRLRALAEDIRLRAIDPDGSLVTFWDKAERFEAMIQANNGKLPRPPAKAKTTREKPRTVK